MNKSTQIATIIEKRRPLAARIEKVEQNLQSLASALGQLEEYRTFLKGKAEDTNMIAALDQIDLLKSQTSLQTELDYLNKLKVRFSRNTLNIGVVGRARQGKSRLLQSLTKLTRAEIPDGDRQHCTGVRSTIYHTPNVETYGEVTFHSEYSFLTEVIAPYYRELKLGNPPVSLEAFVNQPLQGLSPELIIYAEPKAKYEYLRRYRSKFQEYSPFLQQASPRRISRNQIREYVAQDDLAGERIYFKYMAVKEVKIFCPFLNEQVEQIALVDMPGLGDTGIGDEARLMEALGQDVDIVLFVRMPKAGGDSWLDVDVRLYDIAFKALVELPIDLWSFMVLNQTDATSKNGDNAKNCDDLKNSFAEKHINVIDCLKANCSKSEAAAQVLDRVLTYLMGNITTLDKRYAESRQLHLLHLHRTTQDELEKAQRILEQHANSDQLFKDSFNQFWDALTQGLEDLLREIRRMLGKDDPAFKEKVADVLRKCREDAGLPPDLATLEQGRDREGGYTDIYSDYLRKIRTDLSKHFLLLDGQIQQSLDNIKTKIARKLVNQIGLKIVDVQDPKILKTLAQQIRTRVGSGNLELGFQTLGDFDVSFAGIMQRQLRDYLDELTADRHPLQKFPQLSKEDLLAIAQILAPLTLQNFLSQFTDPTWLQVMNFVQPLAEEITDPSPEQSQALQAFNSTKRSAEPDGQQVLKRLHTLHKQVVTSCEEILNRLLKEPNHIAYSMTAEFVDRVLRSGKQRPGDVKDEWEIFLNAEDIKSKIWTQFQQLSDRKQEQREWGDRVDAAMQANSEALYHFLD